MGSKGRYVLLWVIGGIWVKATREGSAGPTRTVMGDMGDMGVMGGSNAGQHVVCSW